MKLELIFYKNIKNQNKLYSFKIYNKCNQNYNKKTKNSQFVIVKKILWFFKCHNISNKQNHKIRILLFYKYFIVCLATTKVFSTKIPTSCAKIRLFFFNIDTGRLLTKKNKKNNFISYCILFSKTSKFIVL